MSFSDLQSFLKHLEEIGELDKVTEPVDPYLEIAAIVDHVCKNSSKKRALLFENVKGSTVPLVANLFGTQRRVSQSLGVDDIETLANRLRDDLRHCKAVTADNALEQLIRRCPVETVPVDSAPSFNRDVSREGLDAIPALHAWPGDGGRYLTLGQVVTRHPVSGQQNCGMYRVQILDKQTALIRCHPGSGGSAHMSVWHALGKAMPIAISLGGPPALTWCAGVSLPDNVSEYDFSGYLSGRPIAVAQCQNSGLHVPSLSEIIIEGVILPGEVRDEGPFGNHTGYYSLRSPAPVLRVKSVFMRESAVYPCTVVGPPPMENVCLAWAAGRLMLPLLQYDCPWISDLHMPLEGIYHKAVLISVDAPKTPMPELDRMLRQTRFLHNSRLIVLTDKGCNLGNAAEVYWRFVNAGPWGQSVLINGDTMTIDARKDAQRLEVHADRKTMQYARTIWKSHSPGAE